MAESWVRLWSGMTTDPKWQTVARKSGQPRYLVIALFTHLMLEANEADERGSLAEIDIEDVASTLDCDEEAVEAILQAMEGRVIDDGRLSGWDRRQPIREDSGNPHTGALSSTERSRLHREKKKQETQRNARNDNATQCNAPEAEAEAEGKPPFDKERGKADREVEPPPESLAPQVTDAGSACLQMRAAGIQGVNPSHPKLLALLAAGITPNEIGEVAREERAKGKGMAWVLAVVEGRRREAANVTALPAAIPSGGARASPAEQRRQKQDAWLDELLPNHRRKPQPVKDLNDERTLDAKATRRLG